MLNEHGFKRKQYNDLVDEMSIKARELYGSDVNVSKSSVLGIIIRIVAWFLSLAHELAEKVYYSGFLSQAAGVSLDRLGSNSGTQRNPATVAMVELSFTGKPNYVIGEGMRFSTENKIVFEMIDVVTIDENGNGSGMAISVLMNKESNVPAKSIVVPLEPTEELFTVINNEKAEGGAQQETDKEYRERIKLSIRGNPGPPINGIMSALLEVPGVRTVGLIENKTMNVDSYGNPPKSIHAFVLGGTKENIGQALFNSVAAGIETVGSITTEVSDIGGFKHKVHFDYASSVNIFTSITITTNENYEHNGDEQVINAALTYINSLTMGESVRFSFIYPELYKIPGVVVAEVKIGKSADTVEAKDIILGPNESAQAIYENVVIINEP